MKCPYCNGVDTRVVDSRDQGAGVRRRRECPVCGVRFTTSERLQSRSLFVIKKDQRREEFNRDKLLSGIRRACEKRPLPTGALDKAVDEIETELYQSGKAEVTSAAIGDLVMAKLARLDHIAYIRFASVYREFGDIRTLKRAVDVIVERGKEPSSQLALITDSELGSRPARKRALSKKGA